MRHFKVFLLVGLLFVLGCGKKSTPPQVVKTTKPKGPEVLKPAADGTWYGKMPEEWVVVLRGDDDSLRPKASEILVKVGPEVVPGLIEALTDENEQAKRYAVITLTRMGQPAIPGLIDGLADEKGGEEIRAVLETVVNRYPNEIPQLVKALKHKDPVIRAGTAQVLGKMESDADKALPGLQELLDDDDENVRVHAAEALAEIGVYKDAIPKLIEVLKDKPPRVRAAAARALAGFKETPEDGVPKLIELAQNDQDEGVRAGACMALGKVAESLRGKATPVVRTAVKDKSPKVRARAVAALGNLEATSAIPDIRRALQDEDEEVKQSAARALGNFGKEAAPAVATVVLLLGAKEAETRLVAVRTLTKLAEAEVPGVSTGIVKAVGDDDEKVRNAAIQGLFTLPPDDAARAVPGIVTILKDEKSEVGTRKRMIEFLGKLGPAAEKSVPILTTVVQDQKSGLNMEAATALGNIGKPAIPGLIEALKLPNNDIRGMAAHGLAQMGKAAAPAVPVLAKALADSEAPVSLRETAALALMNIGPASAPAVTELANAAKERDVRKSALGACERIGAPAVKPLIAVLQEKNSSLRQAIFLTMRRIGKPAVPGMIAVLQDKNSNKELREGAIKTLGIIGPAAQAALPALREAVNDSDKDISKSAAAALTKIEKR